RVDLHRGRDLRVSEDLHCHARRNVAGCHPRRGRVPEIMEPNATEASALAESTEPTPQIRWLHWRAGQRWKHKVVLFPTIAGKVSDPIFAVHGLPLVPQ